MDLKDGSSRQPQQIALTSTLTGKCHVVFVRNIIYITRYKEAHNTFVHYQDAFTGRLMCISVRGTLKEFFEILPNQFQKVNRSVIVNLRYVVEYTKDEVAVLTTENSLTKFPHKNDISQFIVEL